MAALLATFQAEKEVLVSRMVLEVEVVSQFEVLRGWIAKT